MVQKQDELELLKDLITIVEDLINKISPIGLSLTNIQQLRNDVADIESKVRAFENEEEQ